MTKFGGNAGGDGGDNATGEDGTDLSLSSSSSSSSSSSAPLHGRAKKGHPAKLLFADRPVCSHYFIKKWRKWQHSEDGGSAGTTHSRVWHSLL